MTFGIIPFLASSINGASFGSLLFVGAVDVRTLLVLTSTRLPENEVLLRKFFSLWWPYGRDLMLPVGVMGLFFNIKAYFSMKENNNRWYWLIPSVMHTSIVLWTGLVMGGTIKTLLNGETHNFSSEVRKFCYLHFPRVLFAGVGYAFSTFALMSDNDSK